MAKKSVVGGDDVFMQFAVLQATWAAVSTTLVEGSLKTGLSIRGGLLWLIHMIQIYQKHCEITNAVCSQVVSSIEGLSALPTPTDKGCLEAFSHCRHFTTNGGSVLKMPHEQKFLPPIPFAGPNLSLYLQSTVDAPLLDGTVCYARVGYTTAPIDKDAYAELAEVWEQA